MEYMLVEKGYKYNSEGGRIKRRGTGSYVSMGFEQVEDTNTYKTMSGAILKRKAIYANKEWGYEYGSIKIAKIELVE